MIRIKVLVLILLAVVNCQLLSGETFSISGILTDEISKESIISATIMLFNNDTFDKNSMLKGVYTNKYGFYSLTNIKPGRYFLNISSIGYKRLIHEVLIDTSDVKLNISLKTVDLLQDELLVVADKESSPTKSISTIYISPKFVSKMPALGGEIDIFRTLQLLPGISSASEMSSGLYVRGGSPDQNLVLLDGVTVYNPSHLAGFISSFNNDAIRDIRMIKGAFPAEYGGRLSSVLDLTMKEGTREKLSGSGGISLISSKLTLEGPIDEKSSFMISGRRFYFDLLLSLFDDAPSYYFYDVNAKANYKLSDNDHLYVSGYFATDVFGVNDEFDNSDVGIDWGNKTANIRWMHIVNPELFTNFSLIYTDYSFNSNISESDLNFNSISRIKDIVLKGDLQYLAYDNHIIKSGLDITWHNFLSGANFNDIDLSMESDLLGTKEINTFDIATYIQDEWKVSDKLDFNFGVRTYYFQQGNYFDIEPRLSGTYLLDNGIRLKAALAVANQYLHLVVRNNISLPTDLWFPSTENIKPSRSIQGVFGFETKVFDDSYLFSFETYYKSMRNLLEFKDDAVFTLGIPLEDQFTSGDGEAYGFEFFLNKRVGNFTGWIGYTLAWTIRQFDDLNKGRPFFPRYDRRHDISLTLNYELGKSWELGLAWIFGSGQAFTLPTSAYHDNISGYNQVRYNFSERNGVRAPSYHRLDLNFMHKFEMYNIPWVFSINIFNAYSRRNPFALYLGYDYSTFGEETKTVKQITLFPIIPTFGLSFEF